MDKILCTIKTFNRHEPVIVCYLDKSDVAFIACENCNTLLKNLPKQVNLDGDVI